MTRVQMRLTAVIAALAMVACCCALAFAAPQKAQADVVASTMKTSTELKYATAKSLSYTDDSYFNSSVSSKYYRFTTSDRNSSYKLTLSNLEQDFGVYVYDSAGRVIDEWTTEYKTKRKYELLDRKATYYIELRRTTDITTRADYTIKLKEIVAAPPAINNFKAYSSQSGKVTVSVSSFPSAVNGFQVKTQRNWGKNKKATTLNTKVNSKSVTYETTYSGNSHPYKISIRSYRNINGKYYYGPWSKKTKTVKVKD